jgi:uncharacterized membrane protein (UPF0136 family)
MDRLAKRRRSWQETRMSDRSGPQAGGFLLALAILVGTVVGGLKGQPTIGLLAGLAIGSAAAVALWLIDRSQAGR